MKFPSLISTLSLLKPLKNSNKKTHDIPEKNLYDSMEDIISIYDTHSYADEILERFYRLSEIHQQILIVTLIEHNIVNTLEVLLNSSYNVNFLIRGQTPLHFAIKSGNMDMVELLIKHDADLEFKDNYKETALNCAVRAESNEIIKYLLKQGANVNTQASDSSSPLTFAVHQGNSEAVSILLEYGALLDRSHLVKTL